MGPMLASLQIYALQDGDAQQVWEEIGGEILHLSPERDSHVDWSMYVLFFHLVYL